MPRGELVRYDEATWEAVLRERALSSVSFTRATTEPRDEARIARLAALARCCRHSAIARTARRVAAAVALLRTIARHGTPTACCTPA